MKNKLKRKILFLITTQLRENLVSCYDNHADARNLFLFEAHNSSRHTFLQTRKSLTNARKINQSHLLESKNFAVWP